jgi:hypothetical protein
MKHFTTARVDKLAQVTGFANVLILAIAGCLSTSPATVFAKNPPVEKAGAPAKQKTAKKITYQRSASEETPAERDRRLYRECKGMHNAGACRGYTR